MLIHKPNYQVVHADVVQARLRCNESGKGDHRHFNNKERAYDFSTPDQLIAGFQHDIARWNRENRNS